MTAAQNGAARSQQQQQQQQQQQSPLPTGQQQAAQTDAPALRQPKSEKKRARPEEFDTIDLTGD